MKRFLIPVMIALMFVLAGCESETQPPDKPDPKPKVEQSTDKKDDPAGKETPKVSEKPKRTVEVRVFFPDDMGTKLVEVGRKIEIIDDADKYQAAVETLLTDPTEKGLIKIFPKNAKILSVKVSGDMATIDLDGGLKKNFVGGSTGEELLIGSIVDTLTNFPEVKRVRVLIDGHEVETLAGHMDLSQPLERMIELTE